MNEDNLCSYCYKMTFKSSITTYLQCTCKICENCINFLKSFSIFSCPLCYSNFDPGDSLNSECNSLTACVNNQNINKKSQSRQISLKSFSNNLKRYSNSLEIKKNSLKTLNSLKNTQKISESDQIIHNFSNNLFEMLNFIKELNVFQYNQKYFLILFNDYFTSCAIEMKKLSRLGLEREKKSINKVDDCYFLGYKITFSVINNSRFSHEFKIFTDEPCELVEIGIGRPIGLSSSLFLFNFCIVEDNMVIYREDIMMEIHNSDSRLTAGIVLNKPVVLENEKIYKLIYEENANFQYILRYPKDIMGDGPIKVQSIKFSGCSTFYLKIKKCLSKQEFRLGD